LTIYVGGHEDGGLEVDGVVRFDWVFFLRFYKSYETHNVINVMGFCLNAFKSNYALPIAVVVP
jgi:hypothetical protein